MIVNTQISYGHESLIEVFFKANDLTVTIQDMRAYPYGKIILHYEDDSDTALAITMLSYKHLGFENMLCDYLIKCGISPSLIPIGKAPVKRDMDQVDKEWQEHRRAIGLAR
jgi:hypothetical protein